MSIKRWYLKAGSKQVGPMTSGRVRARIAEGKLPARTRAWREGMDEWDFVKDLPEFSDQFDEARGVGAGDGDATQVMRRRPASSHEQPTREMPGAEVDEAVAEAKRRSDGVGRKADLGKTAAVRTLGARKKTNPSALAVAPRRGGSAIAAAKGSGGIAGWMFPDTLPLRFEQPYRIEKTDLTRGIGLGMAMPRIKLLTVAMFITTVLAFAPAVALLLHPILGALVALVIAPVNWALTQIAMGALSYQTRVQIESGRTPSVGEAFAFARGKAVPLAVTPIVLFLASLVPIIGLAVLTAINFVPTVGPILNGLIFGLHVLLAAAALFLMIAYCLSFTFGPVIVAFEETGVSGTMQVLFDLVRRSMARFLLWAWRPALAYAAFSLVVILVAAVVIALPLALNVVTGGGAALAQSFGGMGGMGGLDDFGGRSRRLTAEDFGMTPEEHREAFGEEPPAPAPAPEEAPAAAGSDAPGLPMGPILAMIPTALWVALFAAMTVALLGSASNGIVCMFYLAGRSGNDDLISRDGYNALMRERSDDATSTEEV